MKQLRNITLALLFGAILAVSAFADGKPNQGGPGNGGPGGGTATTYGLSDSCWKVFLSQLSPADAGKISADQATITGNQTQIDALNKQIGDLLKNATGKRDSATMAKIRGLQSQIDALNKANGAAQMDIDAVLKANSTAFQTVEKNCGRPSNPRDTGKGGPRDTSKGGGPKPDGRGHFGLSDSCWNIFLTQISPADAAQLAADQKTISDNQAQIEALIKQIRALKGTKDSVTRAKIKSLMDQINGLMKANGAAMKDYASVIKKNDAILQSIRKDCGRHVHKGSPGDPTNGLTVTDIVPNPATAGSMPTVNITLTADAAVTITLSSATAAQGPPAKVLFNGTLTAGTHTQTLDLSGSAAGIYLVNITSGNQMVTKKLVIQ